MAARLALAVALLTASTVAVPTTFKATQQLRNATGGLLNAHSGHIVKFGDLFYLYG